MPLNTEPLPQLVQSAAALLGSGVTEVRDSPLVVSLLSCLRDRALVQIMAVDHFHMNGLKSHTAPLWLIVSGELHGAGPLVSPGGSLVAR